MSKDIDTKQLESLYESISVKEGSIKIATWNSHTDNSITHMLSYDPNADVFIDISVQGNNVIEQKEIDGSDTEKYSEWYDKDIISKMSMARQS